MKRGKITFLKVVIFSIGVITLSLCVFALPSLAKYTATTYPEYAYLQYPVLIGLYVTAIPFFLALYQSLKLLKSIESSEVFSNVAVHSLDVIKQCAKVIAFLYVIGMIVLAVQNALHPGVAIIGLIILFATIVIMIFAAVLQELLKNIINIKLENELTI